MRTRASRSLAYGTPAQAYPAYGRTQPYGTPASQAYPTYPQPGCGPRCRPRAGPVGALVGSLFALVNELWLTWDPRRQCLHDKAAHTVVIKKNYQLSRQQAGAW